MHMHLLLIAFLLLICPFAAYSRDSSFEAIPQTAQRTHIFAVSKSGKFILAMESAKTGRAHVYDRAGRIIRTFKLQEKYSEIIRSFGFDIIILPGVVDTKFYILAGNTFGFDILSGELKLECKWTENNEYEKCNRRLFPVPYSWNQLSNYTEGKKDDLVVQSRETGRTLGRIPNAVRTGSGEEGKYFSFYAVSADGGYTAVSNATIITSR